MAANLANVRELLGDYSQQTKLIAVSKNASIEQITEACNLGVHDFAESRIQDALSKKAQMAPQIALQTNWHFIGHLQTNKVKQAVGNFSLIHSVDSFKLASEISKTAQTRKVEQAILLQVKMQNDESKSGFEPQELRDCFAQILALPAIKVQGLMTISPLTSDASVWKYSFNKLRELRDELASEHKVQLNELSMGMSDDWQDAITCGSTMIRLGRAIFGN